MRKEFATEPEEFENNEVGHKIETKDLEDEFISTLSEFPDKKSGVNQMEQFYVKAHH